MPTAPRPSSTPRLGAGTPPQLAQTAALPLSAPERGRGTDVSLEASFPPVAGSGCAGAARAEGQEARALPWCPVTSCPQTTFLCGNRTRPRGEGRGAPEGTARPAGASRRGEAGPRVRVEPGWAQHLLPVGLGPSRAATRKAVPGAPPAALIPQPRAPPRLEREKQNRGEGGRTPRGHRSAPHCPAHCGAGRRGAACAPPCAHPPGGGVGTAPPRTRQAAPSLPGPRISRDPGKPSRSPPPLGACRPPRPREEGFQPAAGGHLRAHTGSSADWPLGGSKGAGPPQGGGGGPRPCRRGEKTTRTRVPAAFICREGEPADSHVRSSRDPPGRPGRRAGRGAPGPHSRWEARTSGFS